MSQNQITKKQRRFSAKRLAIDALLAAMFFALSMLSIRAGGLKITFDSLPVVISAMLFGPLDAFLVAFIGSFLDQMMGFGFTATTLLWLLPPASRGLVIGFGCTLFRNAMSLNTIVHQKKPYVYYAVCLLAGVVTSTLNTLIYYVDAVIYHYYEYHLIFGIFGIRVLSGLICAALTATLALPILLALKKMRFLSDITKQ